MSKNLGEGEGVSKVELSRPLLVLRHLRVIKSSFAFSSLRLFVTQRDSFSPCPK